MLDLVLSCFVVQTYEASVIGPAASPQRRGGNYSVLNPPGGGDVNWPPAEALDDQDLHRFAHPLQPLTGD